MFFSVVIPVYNVEKYLPECVDSVLSQTFGDFEVILADDGSTDGSPALCDEYSRKDGRVKVIHKKNGGLSDARNAGTAEAQGKYIIYIDSDDFIIGNDFFKVLHDKIEKNEPDAVFYKYRKYFDKSGETAPCSFSYAGIAGYNKISDILPIMAKTDSFYGMAWIKAVKRSVLSDNNIEFEKGLLGEDMDWNYNLIMHIDSVYVIDESYIAYRQREGSITATHKLKNLTDYIYILEKWTGKIKQSAFDDNVKAALYATAAKYYSNLLIVYARITDKAKKEYKKNLKDLSWLLKYSASKRPKLVSYMYRFAGFNMTALTLKIMDRLK